MRDVTAAVRAFRSAHHLDERGWTLFWGLAWTLLNIGLVIFIVAVAAQ